MRSVVLNVGIRCPRHSFTLLALVACGWMGGRASFAMAQGTKADASRLRDAIPASTVAYAEIPDFASALGHIKSAPLGRILAEEEWKEFLEPLRLRLSKTALAPLGIQGGSVSGGGVHRTELGIFRAEPSGAFVIAMLAEGAPLADAIRKSTASSADVKFEPFEGMSLAHVREFAGLGDACVALGPQRSLLVLSSEHGEKACRSAAEPILAALNQTPRNDGLAQDASFKLLSSKLQTKQADLTGFFRPASLFEDLVSSRGSRRRPPSSQPSPSTETGTGARSGGQARFAESALAAVRELGFLDLTAVAFAESYSESGVEDELYFQLQERKGIVQAVTGTAKPVDRSFLEKAPDGVDSFSTRTVDPRALWNSILAANQASAPKGVDPLEELKAFEKKHGVSLGDDFFGLLGPNAFSYSFPAKPDGLIPLGDFFWFIQLRERARFEKCVDALVGAMGEIKGIRLEVTKGRATIYTLKFDEPGRGSPEMGMVAFTSAISPSFAVIDDWVVFSTSSVALKNEVRRMGKPRDVSADVKKAFAKVAADATALSYYDARPTVRNLYDKLAGFAQLAPGAAMELPLDLQLLPTSQSITKHLRPSTRVETTDANGIRVQWSGSFGVELLGFLIGGATLTLYGNETGGPMDMEPSPSGAAPRSSGSDTGSDEAKTDAAKSMLRKIDAAIRVYRGERGSFPTSLQQLLRPTDDHPQGYLSGLKSIPADPWGSGYYYQPSADGASYQLRSLGRNKRDDGGTLDDVIADSH